MRKKIVIIYDVDDWSKKIPLAKDPMTKKSFEDFYKRGEGRGVDIYRAYFGWFDKKKMAFKKSWTFRNGKWTKVLKPIKPDLIFDKLSGKHDYQLHDFKTKLSNKIRFFNHPLFRTVLDNKLAQYLILEEFMPKSFLATSKKELNLLVKKIKSSMVVIKPLYGSGGFGIKIGQKRKINFKNTAFPVLVQEFIKSTHGIPGFSKKKEIADLRMIYINRKFLYALSRIAKEGSYFTNFHQGATVVPVPKNMIPKSAQKVAGRINKKMGIFQYNYYSLDFIFLNSGKPMLMEINTTPGFDLLHIVGTEAIKEKHFREFVKVLK